MSKPWEADDDFVMYLNSGDRGTHPLEPGVTTMHSAFRQELEIPFMDSSVPLMYHDLSDLGSLILIRITQIWGFELAMNSKKKRFPEPSL